MIISTLLSATGRFSISPNRNSTCFVPIFSAFLLDLEIMSGVMSTPITFPVSPTSLAAKKLSNPPPLPRSTTVSPALREPMATGLPQPSPMFAPSGTLSISPFEYPINSDICSTEKPGTPQPHDAAWLAPAEVLEGPQQDAVWLGPE